MEPIQPIQSYSFKDLFNNNPPIYLCLGLPNGLFSVNVPTEILYVFSLLPHRCHMPHPTYYLYCMAVVIFCVQILKSSL